VSRRITTCVRGKTALALGNLAHDAATVWSLANRRENRTHGIDEVNAQLCGCKLERSLDNVVAVRVAHEMLKLLNVKQLLNHHRLDVWLSTADALLDDVGAELLFGKLANLALEALAHGCREGGVVEVQDVLDNIVAKGVLNQVEAVRRDLANEVDFLEARGMVDATLQDAAAMAVRADSDAMFTYSIKYELRVRGLEVVQALLDDMITVEILDEIDNLSGQSPNDHLRLVFGRDELDHLL
jgi:hypothetical protein